MANNPLYDALGTSVKFYGSLTRRLAKGQDPISVDENNLPIYVESGAICFVSDNLGNSIFLNRLLFGGSGGEGITEITLSSISVTDSGSGKTLLDYFDENGNFISDSIIIKGRVGDAEYDAIEITKNGITLYDSLGRSTSFVTTNDLSNLVLSILENNGYWTSSLILNAVNTALNSAKSYTDSKLSSVYRYKGSVPTFNDLPTQGLIDGDVYNVAAAYDGNAANTNYVWVGPIQNQDGTTTPGHWDPVGGTLDMDALTDVINALVAAGLENVNLTILNLNNSLSGSITSNSGAISNLAGRVQNIELCTGNSQIVTNVNNLATQLTWQ